MHCNEITDAIRLRNSLAIELCNFHLGAVATGHHGDQTIKLTLHEVQVGPLQGFDRYCSVADRDAVAHPKLGLAPLTYRDLAEVSDFRADVRFGEARRINHAHRSRPRRG